MNATSLYVSTNRLVMKCSAEDRSSWCDLYRLVPYLRQSLSCAVCGELLREPWTPADAQCQHHVCRACRGGRKKLKPSCGYCRDYDTYEENVDLRILLQCYKRMCEYLTVSDVYTALEGDEEADGGAGLIHLIKEGATFSDNYKSTAGLSKSAYSILPCVYTNSASASTQTATEAGSSRSGGETSPGKDGGGGAGGGKALSNGSSLYSVMYAGSGNKITIKRKALDDSDAQDKEDSPPQDSSSSQHGFKKPQYRSRSSASNKRKGCRCGNATATPGKLTCCGQRCPCYVESKPCIECKCKGCRNPHRPDGLKVRPHVMSFLEDARSPLGGTGAEDSPSCSGALTLDGAPLSIEAMEEALSFDVKPSNIKVYSSQLQEVSPSLPAAILMDEEESSSSEAEVGCDEGDWRTGCPSPLSPQSAADSHYDHKLKLYSSQLQEVSPSLPAAILMDEEESSSSEAEVGCDEGDWRTGCPSPLSPHSAADSHYDHELNSDVEVDV